jgi:hypothetical protein
MTGCTDGDNLAAYVMAAINMMAQTVTSMKQAA